MILNSVLNHEICDFDQEKQWSHFTSKVEEKKPIVSIVSSQKLAKYSVCKRDNGVTTGENVLKEVDPLSRLHLSFDVTSL